jgi:hypothetical protein
MKDALFQGMNPGVRTKGSSNAESVGEAHVKLPTLSALKRWCVLFPGLCQTWAEVCELLRSSAVEFPVFWMALLFLDRRAFARRLSLTFS